LLDREWFSLVEALEEVSNFWSFGRNFHTMPSYNTYMPTKTHLLNKPDMLDGENDDLGYQFNMNRLSPTGYLNTLRGYKMLPKADLRPRIDPFKPKFYKKYRRLSNPKMNVFSTVVKRDEASSYTASKPTTFLSSIFSSAGPFGTERQGNWVFYRK
jgi:hypothetical protein